MTADPLWRDKAACTPETTNLFFANTGHLDTERAKTICGRCPVNRECLQYAITEDIDHGVWGGLTPHERGLLRRGTA